ncbi:MAG: alkaline phosphatase [Saprospiraceae bacterium]|nr:alkaline phosphatase [Saprospiraceae bacterium]
MRILLILYISFGIFACSSPAGMNQNALHNAPKPPKNVILMIGDGMGLSQITGTMYNSRRGLQMERFKTIGLQKTDCKDDLVTDSAAAAAALARGIKADKNTFGSSEKEKAPPSILEQMHDLGWATGMVVTCSMTHATPAAFVSYQPQRSMYEEIATDFLKVDVDYLVGGGRQYFDRRSVDDRDLIQELTNQDVVVKSYLDGEIIDLNISPQKRFMYFSADSEPISHLAGRTCFPDACERGIAYLQKRSPKGFFLMIEGSQIDWGGHANVAEMVMDELEEFDMVIGKILDFAARDKETLVIVTADHETGGFAIVRQDKKGKPVVAFVSKDHTGTMIPVFAYGPGSDKFAGIYPNSDIPQKIQQILKINGSAQ